MEWLVNAKEMKQCDTNTSDYFGISSDVLMERASDAFCQCMKEELSTAKHILVLCGTGNNGGDGLCIARTLYLQGKSVNVYFPLGFPKKDSLCGKKLAILQKYGLSPIPHLPDLERVDVIIDAVFGTGLSRALPEELQEQFALCAKSTAKKIAVDIPSGVSADDGRIFGSAFFADITVTFGFRKLGQLLYPGAAYCGALRCVQMGITKESFLESKPQCYQMEESDLCLIPKRPLDAHKNTFRKILLIAGSKNMSGAAYFSAKAAYRTGAGYVTIYTAEENRSILQERIPEAVLESYRTEQIQQEDWSNFTEHTDRISQEDRTGQINQTSQINQMELSKLLSLLKKAEMIVMGPGLGTSDAARKILEIVLMNATVPVLLDADALNILAQNLQLCKTTYAELAITPHLGEMSRLTKDATSYLNEHMLEATEEFANEYHVICHLKNACSVTKLPFGKTFLTSQGNSGMATAGSGDVLTGIIAGVYALGASLEEAVPLGAMIHALAGKEAAKDYGKDSLMASDLLDEISKVMRKRDEHV